MLLDVRDATGPVVGEFVPQVDVGLLQAGHPAQSVEQTQVLLFLHASPMTAQKSQRLCHARSNNSGAAYASKEDAAVRVPSLGEAGVHVEDPVVHITSRRVREGARVFWADERAMDSCAYQGAAERG